MRLSNVIVAVFLLALGGCVSSYKMEVQQGNVITPEMVEKLKTGMTKSQVRFVLGTPLITDPFHAERWDYVYIYKKDASATPEVRQVTVIFEGDALKRVDDNGKTLALPAPVAPETSRETRVNPESTAPSSARAL